MKKILNIFLLIFLCFIFINHINASTDINIKNISIYDKSDTIEINKYRADGLNIDTDLFFNELNDYVKFKLVLKNLDDEDYTLSDINSNYDNEYITLSYEYENDDKIFTANSEKTIYVTFTNTKNANNTVDLNAEPIILTIPIVSEVEGTDNIINPKTGYQNVYIILLSILVISIAVFAVTSKKKGLFVLAFVFLIADFYIINAIEEINIEININVTMDTPLAAKAMLKPGNEVTKHMFELANIPYETIDGNISPSCVNENINSMPNDPLPDEYFTCLDSILKYERSNTIPDEYKKPENIISTAESNVPIYMWYESNSKTIYWYSDSKIIYLNEDATQTFSYLQKVKELDLTDIRTRYSTNMSSLFSCDMNITSLDVSNFDTSNVTNMLGMFSVLKKLESIDVSNFDTSKVTDMRFMFGFDISLEKLDLSSFNTSHLSQMEEMISECFKLKELDISSFDLSLIDGHVRLFGALPWSIDTSLIKIKTPAKINNSSVLELSYVYTDGNRYYEEIDSSTPNSTWLIKTNEDLIPFNISIESCPDGSNGECSISSHWYYRTEGMTWGEWLNSKYNYDNITFVSFDKSCSVTPSYEKHMTASYQSYYFFVSYSSVIYDAYQYVLKEMYCSGETL